MPCATLTEWLREKFHGFSSVNVAQFPAGHSNLTYLIRGEDRELILRRPPHGRLAPKAHDVSREFRFLRALYPLFALAPKPVALCEDVGVIGAPFFLMERCKGRPMRPDTDSAATVSEQMAACLAELHAVDVRSPEVAALGKPDGFLARQVAGWSERWNSAAGELSADAEMLQQWLAAHQPESREAAVLHHDFKLDNVLFEDGKLSAVLDWELAAIGDPLADLGTTLCYWQLHSNGLAGHLVDRFPPEFNLFSRDEFLHVYSLRTGRDLHDISWYEVLGIFKLAVILQQIHQRFVNGETADERFADFHIHVRTLLTWARQAAA